MNYQDVKHQCYEANLLLPKLGLVMFTFGNVSVVDRENGVFAIKPSGVPYETLKPDDIVIVDFDSKVVDGQLRPSSDTKTHAWLYRSWPDIGGISHTHSTYATAWAQALRDIPILGTTHADHLPVDIPCAPAMSEEAIRRDYEHETALQIIQELEQRQLSYHEVEMILLGHHGPFTWGKTAEKAVYNSAVLEELARMAYLARTLRPGSPRLPDALIRKHYERKHGKNAYYGQDNAKKKHE